MINSLNDDIRYAEKIIGNSYNNNNDKSFHNTSFIYKTTNENIDKYFDYLKNKNKVLSVISSGDQIINSILSGTKEITAFDISRFPRYFLYFKLASILSLTQTQYLNLFYEEASTNSEYYDELYEKIRKNLDLESKKFWDKLFDFYEWFDIYSSNLYSHEPYSKNIQIQRNPYLIESNYKKLKSLIPNTNLKYINSDLRYLFEKTQDKYDLIYLSNILEYMDKDEYFESISKLNLSKNGIVLSYFFNNYDKYKKFEKDKQKVKKLNSSSGIIITRN